MRKTHPAVNMNNITLTTEDNSTLTTTALATSRDYCPPQAVPSETYRHYRIAVEVYAVSCVCAFGIVGNALSIAVLCRAKERKAKSAAATTSTNWLLQSLAVVDTLYLVCCLFIQTINCLLDFTDWVPSLVAVFPYLEPWVWAVASCVQTMTVWLVLLVTLDRYIAVCVPLNQQLRSKDRAQKALLVVVLLAIVYNIPRFFERTTTHKLEPGTNRTIACTEKTSLRDNYTYILVYKTIMYFIFRSVGPLVSLIFFNIRLTQALIVVHRRQAQMTQRKRRTENITSMLIAVVTVFIICEIPDTALRIVLTVNNYSSSVNIPVSTLRVANVITNLLLTINSSINFLIYVLIGTRFRLVLAQMCHVTVASEAGGECSETEPLTLRTVAATAAVAGATGAGGANNGIQLAATTSQHQQNGDRPPIQDPDMDVQL